MAGTALMGWGGWGGGLGRIYPPFFAEQTFFMLFYKNQASDGKIKTSKHYASCTCTFIQ